VKLQKNFTTRIVSKYDYVFTFGKYKGYKLEYVIDVEPSYIIWLSDENVLIFTPEIIETATENYADSSSDDYREDYESF